MVERKHDSPVEERDLNTIRELGSDVILDILAKDKPLVDPALIETISEIRRTRAKTLHSDIIYALTSLRFDEEKALWKWKGILEHKYTMSRKLARNVGVRVAALDYFLNITQELEQVTMIDVGKYEETARDSITDWLTGVFQKGYFLNVAQAEIERSRRNSDVCSVLFFDIDHFKLYNDTHGHLMGDALLRLLANYVSDLIRPYDIMGRYGGEEFVILFPSTKADQALQKGRDIGRTIENLPFPGGEQMPGGHITISGGIAAFPTHAESLDELLKAADETLYRAKNTGRNKVLAAKSK